MKYHTIYADPPWIEHGGGGRGANAHYPLMKTKGIIAMAPMVQDLAEDNAHLYLWTTNNFLRDALEVMDAWGVPLRYHDHVDERQNRARAIFPRVD